MSSDNPSRSGPSGNSKNRPWRSSMWSRVGMAVAALAVLPLLQFVNRPNPAPNNRLGSKLALEDSPSDLRGTSTDQVIDAGLKKPKAHWAWHELEGRDLTAAEAERLVNGLIAWMREEFPYGNIPPLGEVSTVLKKIDKARLVNQSLAVQFNRTLHGGLRFKEGKNPLRLRAGSRPKNILFDWSYNWHPDKELFGMTLLSELKLFQLDGEQVPLQEGPQNPSDSLCWIRPLDPDLLNTLPPGKHKAHIEVTTALVKSTELEGIDSKQGFESGKALSPIERWTRTADLEIQVYAKDEAIIALTDDPKLDPLIHGFSAEPVYVRDQGGKSELSISFDASQHQCAHVSFDVTVRIKDQLIKCGPYFLIESPTKDGASRTTAQPPVAITDLLPTDATTADLILTPNPIWIELDSRVERMWGKEIVFNDVLLVRPKPQDSQTDGTK